MMIMKAMIMVVMMVIISMVLLKIMNTYGENNIIKMVTMMVNIII